MTNCTYLIIGNGIAGTTAAEHIRRNDSDGVIMIITDEPTPFYSRIRLNEYLTGDMDREQLIVRQPGWYKKNKIELRLNTRITGPGSAPQTAHTDQAEEIRFTKLLMAQGSSPFIPPIPGADTPGVFSIRTIDDADHILARAEKAEQIILIGGGLLGLEAGYGLSRLGKPVHVVEFFPRLLPRQLDDEGSKRLVSQLTPLGFTFHLGAETAGINGGDEVTSISLKDGTTLPGELVIISAGVRPNVSLAERFGVDCDRGVLVNDLLQTSQGDIYAAGDVCNHKGMNYGIWPAALTQGKIAGINMAGGNETYPGTVMANSLKVAGINLASAGNIDADNKHGKIVTSTATKYQKIVIENEMILGCIMLGETSQFNQITRHIQEKTTLADIPDELLQGDVKE